MSIVHLADYKVSGQKIQYQCYLAMIFLAIYIGCLFWYKESKVTLCSCLNPVLRPTRTFSRLKPSQRPAVKNKGLVLWSRRDYNITYQESYGQKPRNYLRRSVVSTHNTYVRARIDTETKERAAYALEKMGLSISDAIRLLMLRVAEENRLPFEVRVPNATTRKAITELEAGKGKKFTSIDALMADLHADD